MNKNTKMTIGILIAVIIVIGFIFGVKSAIDKAALEKVQNKAVATVSGEPITKKEFDIMRENNKLKGIKMGDQEVLSRMTVQKALYLYAVKQERMELDEVAISGEIYRLKEKLIKENKYEILKSDLKNLRISEKDYWASETERVKENGIREFYKKIAREEFMKTVNTSIKSVAESKFKEFYDKVNADAIFEADIKILIDVK